MGSLGAPLRLHKPSHAGPSAPWLHSDLDSFLLGTQTSDHYSLGLGSEGFQVAQLGGLCQ